tara:strand:+ start:7 stop:285 length:279 start_codon:yes stop_codon:yes gene_type:complete
MKSKKYVTVNNNGLGLHAIAKIMTDDGDKMNHSTVRNIINRSFVKVAKNMTNKYDLKYSEEQIFNIAKSPEFQESIVTLLHRKSLDKNERTP